jgi:multidrug efflux pump
VATVLTLIVTPALLMFGERNRRVGMIDGVPAE